jgi:hypothetical protein
MKFLGPPSSGSQAGTTSSHNRAGQYTRSRRTPVNTVGTGRRAIVRANFGAASSGWASLTAVQQAGWNSYAAGYPYTDSLGQSITLTGHQMYVAIVSSLANVGLEPPQAPPSSNATIQPVIASFTAVSGEAITLTLAAGGNAGDFVLIGLSAPQSSGRSFCKTFWQQTFCSATVITPQVLTVAYEAQFGTPPSLSRIFYRLTPVNQYGVGGVPLIGFISVA